MNLLIINKYYSNNPKWYHTKQHIEDLYFLYNVYKPYFKTEFPELNEEKLFTCFDFHDAVYIPGSKTNEEDSVQIYLNEGGRDKEVIDAILSTKIGVKDFKNDLQKVLHDLDWNGFRDHVTLKKNEEKIISEAVEKGGFTEKDAIEGQMNFYRFIQDTDIYVTKTFEKFNNIVKLNIKRRLNG